MHLSANDGPRSLKGPKALRCVCLASCVNIHCWIYEGRIGIYCVFVNTFMVNVHFFLPFRPDQDRFRTSGR